MRFLVMHKLPQDQPEMWSPTPELIRGMEALMAEAVESGVLLATEGVLPPAKDGALLRISGGEHTVTDGPFAEAKEVIAGFALIQVAGRAEAVDWAHRFGQAVGGDVEVEIRRVAEYSDFDPEQFPPEARAAEQALRDQLTGS
jgi:hypothetical protein